MLDCTLWFTSLIRLFCWGCLACDSWRWCQFSWFFPGSNPTENQLGVQEAERQLTWMNWRHRSDGLCHCFYLLKMSKNSCLMSWVLNALLQVAQLRVENSSLLRRLADVNQKFNEAAVDNRVLKADVETLRAKVCYFVYAIWGLYMLNWALWVVSNTCNRWIMDPRF